MESPEPLFPSSDLSQVGVEAEFIRLQGHDRFGCWPLCWLHGDLAGSSGSSCYDRWLVVVDVFHYVCTRFYVAVARVAASATCTAADASSCRASHAAKILRRSWYLSLIHI